MMVVFALIGGGIVVLKTYLRIKRERALRDNYPTRRVIEVTLPSGTDKARFMNASFWAKVSTSTSADPKDRREGIGQIDFKYIATVAAPKTMPVLKVLICSDADKMNSVKKALKTVYEDINVIELDEDPLAVLAADFTPKEAVEPEQMQ